MTTPFRSGERIERDRLVLRDLTAVSPKPFRTDRAARPMRMLVSSASDATRAS